MSATIRRIVDDATQLIGEVAGVGVQQYDDDVLMNHAIRGFNLLFKKEHWANYREWFTVTLDGVTGKITTDAFEQVIDFDDFIAIHVAGEKLPLPTLSKNINPNTITGTRARCYTSLSVRDSDYVGRKLQIYPLASTGSLNVHARVYPIAPPATNWDWEDVMYLDKDMLVYATAFMALIGNSLNPDAANVCKELMEMKFSTVTAGLSSQPIPIEGDNHIPSEWMVR
jgi:hypothetical protein